MFERYCHEVDHELAYIATQKYDACDSDLGDYVNALKKVFNLEEEAKACEEKITAIKDAFNWEVIDNNVEANSTLTDRYVHAIMHLFYILPYVD